MLIKRSDIGWVKLNPVIGSEQGGIRPALIIQNDLGNKHSRVTIVAPLTGKIYEKLLPMHVVLSAKESGLKRDSTILLNQIRTIDKARLIRKVSSLNKESMKRVDFALKVSLGLE